MSLEELAISNILETGAIQEGAITFVGILRIGCEALTQTEIQNVSGARVQADKR